MSASRTPLADECLPAMPAPGGAPVELKTCWNEIGVEGDGTCAELRNFIHCRNCPVYASAGADWLNRALPPEYRRDWTEHFAKQKRLSGPGGVSAVLFRLDVEWLALPTRAFQEIAERRRIHSLPHRRQGIVLGLANVRGELSVCVSLGHLLGLENVPPREKLRAAYHRLLMVNWEGNRFAFPVDQVYGPHRFQAQEIKAPPATATRSNLTYIKGVLYWQERAVGLLEPERLFASLNRSLT